MTENKMNEKETVEFIQEMIKKSEKYIDDKGAYKCGKLYESEVKEENKIPTAFFSMKILIIITCFHMIKRIYQAVWTG